MPSVTVHLRLAEQVLDSWRSQGRTDPFDPFDTSDANAFRQGAFGPDLGYIPGGHRPLSDLAHCLRTGDLSRALVARARTSRERAFAWGWVTHVLADTMVHPLVGCAVGELVHGSPALFDDGDAQPVAHVRVESGLDAVYAERFPALRKLRLRPAFDAASIGFLVGAFLETYRATPPAPLFLSSHVSAARGAARGLLIAAATALTLQTGRAPIRTGGDGRRGPLGRVRATLARSCVGMAYLLPVPPPLWLLDAVRDVEEDFVELFEEELEMGGEGLANVNLDTGRPDVDESNHGGFQRSVSLLRDLGGQIPALPLLPIAVPQS